MLIVRLAGDHLYVHLAVACNVLDGVFLCCPFLDEIWDLIESVSEGFLFYSYIHLLRRYTLLRQCRIKTSHGITTRGYQKVLSLTWKEPEIWIYSALFFNVVPFQLHTLVPSSFPVINTRSVEVNILVP